MEMVTATTQLWRALFERSPDGIVLLQALRGEGGAVEDFLWLDANSRALVSLGLDGEALRGERMLALQPHLESSGEFDRYVEAIEGSVAVEFERQEPREREGDEGGRRASWYAVTAIPVDDDRLVVLLRSITELKSVLSEAIDLMHRDDVTGRANRRYLKTRFWSLHQRLATFSLLFFDLDGFKQVNDTYDHAVGNEVLRIVARRLEQNVRPDEVVARIGGDEFAVLIRTGDRASVVAITARLLEAIAAPIHIGAAIITVGSSAGAATYPDDGDGFEEVLRSADQRMYRHKRGES
jgi:diguanylate cyclase (GGDEF)-like protein